MRWWLTFLFGISAICGSAWGSPSPQKSPSSDQLLWDAWYTVTVNKRIPIQYYNDRVELKKGRIHFQNHVWKKEEDYLNEEQLGVFAENNEELTPLFFNFRSTYRTSETIIDGNVKDGKLLTVKIRAGNRDIPPLKKNIPQKTFFSSLFPVWISRQIGALKPGTPVSFKTIHEDDPDRSYSPLSGSIMIEKPDEIATRTKTRKLRVDYRGLRSYWWINESGIAERIEMPDQGMIVEKVSKEKATRFLGGPE